ncbi:MAG TPA: DUF1801 domain-containing protein [Thermoanaerobaculia bacterium]|nr:DUF1801 domain-containing protein [Thermoanaerobaculia bacterium]
MRPPPPELLDFLAPYDAAIVELVLAARARLLQLAPEATETVWDAVNAVATGFSFTPRWQDGFCYVAACTTHVNLGFYRGASIPDPHGLLEGTGNVSRHIKLWTLADLEKPHLDELIRAAMAGSPLADAAPQTIIRRMNSPKRRRPGAR